MALAAPVRADCISGKTSHVQLLAETKNSGDQHWSTNPLHVKNVCLLVYTSIGSTNLRQLERCPAVWSDCHTAT